MDFFTSNNYPPGRKGVEVTFKHEVLDRDRNDSGTGTGEIPARKSFPSF